LPRLGTQKAGARTALRTQVESKFLKKGTRPELRNSAASMRVRTTKIGHPEDTTKARGYPDFGLVEGPLVIIARTFEGVINLL